MTKIIYETHANGHWKELFKSKNKLLGGHNLIPGEELCATILGVGTEEVFDQETKGKKNLAVLQFQDGIPPMALNPTNAEMIGMLHGVIRHNWKGKQILIHTVKVNAFGKVHDALRVRAKVPRDDDFSEYENKLNSCQNMEQLKHTFTNMPKYVQGSLTALKDEIKGKLDANH